ncbi:MAG: hypothetical protein HWE07_15270 [Cytophagia bacterium]|nr:hypothetical protein [Cytophagia bacterium]
MKRFLFAIMLSLATMAHSQTLDYLMPLGQKLAEDIVNQNSSAFISKELMAVYFKKAIVPTINQELTDTQIEQAINQGVTSSSQAYKDALSQLNGFLDKAQMDKDEFSLWANVPIKVEVHESKRSGAFSAPDPNKDNLSSLTVHFLLGDIVSRIILPATVVALNGEYYIIKLESPESYFQFMEGDYGAIYSNMFALLEKQLGAGSSSVNSLISGNPLIGESYDDEWNKCTVQLVGNNPPTLIRSLASSEDLFDLSMTTQIKVDLFQNINPNDAAIYMYDLLSVFAQEFNIESANQKVKVYTYQALSENKETGNLEASLQLKKGSGDRIVFDLKLILSENADGTANLELQMENKG